LTLFFSDTVTSEVRDNYKAQVKGLYKVLEGTGSISRENIKKMERLEGETVIRPGNHFAFSPNAHQTAYVSVRTADEVIA